jgi:hypothetical protein
MRDLANDDKVREFMRVLGRHVHTDVRIYFTGGATAVLMGWRDSTVDIDLGFTPEADEVFRSIPQIKELLDINIELALPSQFIPAVPGWEDRSIYIGREGSVSFYHYDPYSQALSKIERGHARDSQDIAAMIERHLVEREKLGHYFDMIEPYLYKYPAIDAEEFADAVKLITELPGSAN